MYKNRQSPAPNIKLKAKLYSESQSNGMLCPSALKRHSTLSSSQMKKSKTNYAYLKLQSLYTEKYCTTLIQRQLSSKTPNFLGFPIHLCCKNNSCKRSVKGKQHGVIYMGDFKTKINVMYKQSGKYQLLHRIDAFMFA